MTTWYEASAGVVEAANLAMSEVSANAEDRAGSLQDIWMPTATALLESVREDFEENWPEEAALAKSLGGDFVGQTSDTGQVVSWGSQHNGWREFKIHARSGS